MIESSEYIRIIRLFALREHQCAIERRAYQLWLDRITPLKWLTVGGGTVLSAIAGATVLGKPVFLGDQWAIYGGICALVSSLLTGTHTALKCESHQAECHRLIQQFLYLQTSFQTAQVLPESEIKLKMKELEAKYEEATTKTMAAVAGKYRERAEQELGYTKSLLTIED